MRHNLLQVHSVDPPYPRRLSRLLGTQAPPALALLGDPRLLQPPLLGLLVSLRCPGGIVLEAFDAVRSFPPGGWSLVGGFHSPMERQCLESLLLRRVRVVIVLPRPVAGMRIPAEWKEALDQERLLILTPFPEGNRRFTRDRASLRNVVVSALADAIFIPYAAEGGSVERCAGLAFAWGTPVLTVGGNAQPSLNGRAGRIEEWIAGGVARPAEERFILS